MINSELKHTDFSRYTFEEFLQNDFFISSVKYPTEEIQEFWDRFEKSTPSNIDDYFAAREYIDLKSATKLFSVLLASKRPLITELADKLRLKYPLLPTISPCPTMRLEAIRSIIPISCRRYPKSV